jgi:hypothetical protein
MRVHSGDCDGNLLEMTVHSGDRDGDLLEMMDHSGVSAEIFPRKRWEIALKASLSSMFSM